MCDQCDRSELVGTVKGTVYRKGFMQWVAVVHYEDVSDKGVFSRKYLTQSSAMRGSEKMAKRLAQIRLEVLRAEAEGK